jgi:S1-C subfamily serine protease
VKDEQGRAPVVRASYADFLWGVAREEHAPFPSLGLSTPEQKSGEYFPVILVQKGSVAEQAGFKVKDLLLSMDGVALADKETFNRLMSEKRWGDSAEFRVKRGDLTLTLLAKFRRTAS